MLEISVQYLFAKKGETSSIPNNGTIIKRDFSMQNSLFLNTYQMSMQKKSMQLLTTKSELSGPGGGR